VEVDAVSEGAGVPEPHDLDALRQYEVYFIPSGPVGVFTPFLSM
jgi:hypothetical protein